MVVRYDCCRSYRAATVTGEAHVEFAAHVFAQTTFL